MENREARVTIHMAASLDGFIARRDGSVDWLETSDDFAGGDAMTRKSAVDDAQVILADVHPDRSPAKGPELLDLAPHPDVRAARGHSVRL